jgi:hypothetical protein
MRFENDGFSFFGMTVTISKQNLTVTAEYLSTDYGFFDRDLCRLHALLTVGRVLPGLNNAGLPYSYDR